MGPQLLRLMSPDLGRAVYVLEAESDHGRHQERLLSQLPLHCN